MANLNDICSQLIALNTTVVVIQNNQEETNNLLKEIASLLKELIQVAHNK
jgi:hypothetical protein